MQDVSQEKYRQLQTAPMGKLVLQYSIPAIINLAAVSLYNLIDSIFIGNGVGTLAISGLAVTFPMMNCLIAFNTLVGIGGTTLTSISLGRYSAYRGDFWFRNQRPDGMDHISQSGCCTALLRSQ